MYWKVIVNGRVVDCIRSLNRFNAQAVAVKKWAKWKPEGTFIETVRL